MAVVNRNLSPSTKKQYHCRIVSFLNFLKINHPSLIISDEQDENEDVIDCKKLTIPVVCNFLNQLGTKNNDKETNLGWGVYNNYIKALKDLFKKQNVPMRDEMKQELSEYLKARKKIDAEDIQDGKRKVESGKVSASISHLSRIVQAIFDCRCG